TWPAVAEWIRWREEGGDRPDGMRPLGAARPEQQATTISSRVGYGVSTLADVGFAAGRRIADRAAEAVRSSRALAVAAAQALPRRCGAGHIQSAARGALGRLRDEQARRAADGECFLFDDRVHTNAAVRTRINNVVRGLLHVGVRQGDHV